MKTLSKCGNQQPYPIFRFLGIFCLIYAGSTIAFMSPAKSTVYYVKNGGNDSANGLSDEDAWATIGKVNEYALSPGFQDGDTVRFRRGDVFNDATLQSPGVDSYTIEDYGVGAKPWIGGGTRRAIIIDDTISNLTIRNIRVDGQNYQTTNKMPSISIENVNNLVVDGVDADGRVNYAGPYGRYKYPISIQWCTGYLEVKNCTIQWWGPADMPDPNGEDYANHIRCPNADSILIHDNLIHHMGSDGFHLQHNAYAGGVIEIHHNEIYNCGENAIDLKASSNSEIHHNYFYRTSDFTGNGGAGGSDCPLITAHAEGDTWYNQNNYVHDNILGPSDYPAIRVSGGPNFAVHNFTATRNTVIDCARFATIGSYVTDSVFYYNIIVGARSDFVFDWAGSTANTKFYNNTFYSVDDIGVGLRLQNSHSEFRNNIFVMDDPDSMMIRLESGSPVFSHNLWTNPSNSNMFSWLSTVYAVSDLDSWRAEGRPGELFADPLLADPGAGDLHLLQASPCIDAGSDLGIIQDFDGNPVPHGTAPDIGAFEYGCLAGFMDCNGNTDDGCEVDTTTDTNHCGGCDQLCSLDNATAVCVSSVCEIDACVADYSDCNNIDTDGCETNTTNDPLHCGSCDVVCPAAANADPDCSGSQCALMCHAGWGDCNDDLTDGCEQELGEDGQCPGYVTGCSCREGGSGWSWLVLLGLVLRGLGLVARGFTKRATGLSR